ncbi:DsbA family protein [archaeon]|jgi:protein-disulfide isomerase|nr:DsbA family protein [archaeon]MBT3730657.1 DsbA family protein [archaeon]MBT4669559.1 DsbA family protein [archaeon]MBT5030316.1 DsbA family protein [archaeon]MBT5288391.1 DsbA family protein [archaeon]
MDLRKAMPYLLVIQLLIMLVLVSQVFSLNAAITGNTIAEINTGTNTDTNTAGNLELSDKTGGIDITGDPYLGGDPEEVNVVIIEFSDFECPYCSRGLETVHDLADIYGDKISIVFKDFPLSFHQYAQVASEAAECADEQDMFWEYHDGLFANQALFSDDYFYTLADELGLDSGDFTECLSSGAMASEVRTDYGHGVTAGVRGTPAFFVNGELVSGAQPASSFASLIDPYL